MELVSVVGATGRQGLAQMRQLALAGYRVRALSRNPQPDFGGSVEVDECRVIDLSNDSTYAEAFEGSDAVFYNHPLQTREERANIVGLVGAAANAVGVKRLVWNTSSWIPDKPGDPFTHQNNTDALNALFRSGVPSTVFGSVLFMDNLLTNWARPFIVNEGRYVYAHKPGLLANWISLDDVGKCMVAALRRPDLEGAWMNIGGPERLSPEDVAQVLAKALGKRVVFDPCTPEKFGDLLVDAWGDTMAADKRAAFSAGIAAFYRYNNDSPTEPFKVNFRHVRDRLPEVEFETMMNWAARQDWSDEAHRPSAG